MLTRAEREMFTPNDMPKKQPKHTWTPPIDKQTVQVSQAPTPSADNAKARRLRRNGWDRDNDK